MDCLVYGMKYEILKVFLVSVLKPACEQGFLLFFRFYRKVLILPVLWHQDKMPDLFSLNSLKNWTAR
jgi:hypothetical protein